MLIWLTWFACSSIAGGLHSNQSGNLNCGRWALMCFPLFLSCLSSCLQSCRSAKEAKDFVSGAIASSAHLALGNGTQGPMTHSHLHCTSHRYTQQLKYFQKVGSENQKLKLVLCFCVVSVQYWLCWFSLRLALLQLVRNGQRSKKSRALAVLRGVSWALMLRRNARSEEVVRDGTGMHSDRHCFQMFSRHVRHHETHSDSLDFLIAPFHKWDFQDFHVSHLYISHRFTFFAILYKNLYILFFTHSLHLSITFHILAHRGCASPFPPGRSDCILCWYRWEGWDCEASLACYDLDDLN
jgi:hypothetical protein